MGLGIIGAIVGELRMYAGAGGTAPGNIGLEPETGWLLCNGAAVSRTTYADLFNKIGTFYGTGDGSTTFNLPDITQRFPLGRSRSGTGNSLGVTGGELNHTITLVEMPSHIHTGITTTNGSHNHTGTTDTQGSHYHTANTSLGNFVMGGAGTNAGIQIGGSSYSVIPNTDTQGAHSHSISADGAHGHTLSIDAVGGSIGHNNMPPFQTVHFLIKY